MNKIVGLSIVVGSFAAVLTGKLDMIGLFPQVAVIVMGAAIGLWVASHPSL